eukprot:2061796-Amphidinium_carterae.2
MRVAELSLTSLGGAIVAAILSGVWKGLQESTIPEKSAPTFTCELELRELGEVKARLQVLLALTVTLALSFTFSCCCVCVCGVFLYRSKRAEHIDRAVVESSTSTNSGRGFVASGVLSRENTEGPLRSSQRTVSRRGVPQQGDRSVLAALAASEVRKQ